MKKPDKPVIAIDLGGTKYIVAVIDSKGKVLSRIYRYTLSQEGPKKVIARMMVTIDEAVVKSGFKRTQIGGLVAACPGPIDIEKGIVAKAPNLPRWYNVPVRQIMEDEFKIPTFLTRDTNAAVLGEVRLGAGVGLQNVIYLTVSTGIGGGIVIGGKLYHGTTGAAGEIGHMIILENGPACPCGRHGCLESLASGTAIARMAKERLRGWESSILTNMVNGDIDEIKAEHIAKGARQGDPLCQDVVNVAGYYLGVGLGNIVNIFNPQMIIIGGGVSAMGEMFLRPARKSMKAHAFKMPAGIVRVVKAKLGADSGILGAAIYGHQMIGGGT